MESRTLQMAQRGAITIPRSLREFYLDTSVLFAAIWTEKGGSRLILKLGEAGAEGQQAAFVYFTVQTPGPRMAMYRPRDPQFTLEPFPD